VIGFLTGLGEVLHEVALGLETSNQLLRLHELVKAELLAGGLLLRRRIRHLMVLVNDRIRVLHNVKLN
jgi:hypothetical protein